MKARDLHDLQFEASHLAQYARRIAMRLQHEHPQIAAKYLKMSEFSLNLSTYIDVHEELPPPLLPNASSKLRLPSGGG